MSNEEYRQRITEMLYRTDWKEDNLFLKQVFTIVYRHFIRKDTESLKPPDKYRNMVFQILDCLDPKTMREIYYLLIGYRKL